jgi:hypothetical protein
VGIAANPLARKLYPLGTDQYWNVAIDSTFPSIVPGTGKNAFQTTAVGCNAMALFTTGSSNTAIGNGTLGWSSASQRGSGDLDTAVGNQAAGHMVTGGRNAAVGASSLGLNQAGNLNTVVGYQTAYGYTGSTLVAVGAEAAYVLSTVLPTPPSVIEHCMRKRLAPETRLLVSKASTRSTAGATTLRTG